MLFDRDLLFKLKMSMFELFSIPAFILLKGDLLIYLVKSMTMNKTGCAENPAGLKHGSAARPGPAM